MKTNISCPGCNKIIEVDYTKEQSKCPFCGIVIELNSKKK